MNTNEEYLDSLLRDFENSMNGDLEAEQPVMSEALTEELPETVAEEPAEELSEAVAEEPAEELSEAVEEEPAEELPEAVAEELTEDVPEESIEAEETIEDNPGDYTEELSDELLQNVDEEAFFEGETKNYDELDPLFIESMKNEWESGLNVEEFGFSEDEFSLDGEDLKFDFEDVVADEPQFDEPQSDEPLTDESLADEMTMDALTETAASDDDFLNEALKSMEPASDLDIDFANIFSEAEPSTNLEGLGLELDENADEDGNADVLEGEERKKRNTSLFQRLVQEKEEITDEEEEKKKEKEKEREEKETAKAEKAEAKAAKKAAKAEAKKAKQEEKRVKREAEKAEPREPFSMKSFMVIVLFGATITVCILILSSILSYQPYISNARTYFDAREYRKAYQQLEGIKIRDKDYNFYAQVRTMEKLSSKLEAFENFLIVDKTDEALNSLMEGIALYDEKAEYAESIGLKTEYQLVIDEIENALMEEFSLSADEARTMTDKIGTAEYTRWIIEHI